MCANLPCLRAAGLILPCHEHNAGLTVGRGKVRCEQEKIAKVTPGKRPTVSAMRTDYDVIFLTPTRPALPPATDGLMVAVRLAQECDNGARLPNRNPFAGRRGRRRGGVSYHETRTLCTTPHLFCPLTTTSLWADSTVGSEMLGET